MIELYYLIFPFVLFYFIFRSIMDNYGSFEKHLRPELKKMGFEYKYTKKPVYNSSSEIANNLAITQFNKWRIVRGAIARGLASIIDSTYKIIREVGIKDEGGKEYKVLAVIEFSDSLIRNCSSISWHPDLEKIKHNDVELEE